MTLMFISLPGSVTDTQSDRMHHMSTLFFHCIHTTGLHPPHQISSSYLISLTADVLMYFMVWPALWLNKNWQRCQIYKFTKSNNDTKHNISFCILNILLSVQIIYHNITARMDYCYWLLFDRHQRKLYNHAQHSFVNDFYVISVILWYFRVLESRTTTRDVFQKTEIKYVLCLWCYFIISNNVFSLLRVGFLIFTLRNCTVYPQNCILRLKSPRSRANMLCCTLKWNLCPQIHCHLYRSPALSLQGEGARGGTPSVCVQNCFLLLD